MADTSFHEQDPFGSYHELTRKDLHGKFLSGIEIIARSQLPVQKILKEFKSSINIISWNKAYSIFPQYAFIDQRKHSLKCLYDQKRRAVKNRVPSGLGTLNRYIGDRYTWTIHFNTTRVTPPETESFKPHNVHFETRHTWGRRISVNNTDLVYSPLYRSLRSYKSEIQGCWIHRVLDPRDQPSREQGVASAEAPSPSSPATNLGNQTDLVYSPYRDTRVHRVLDLRDRPLGGQGATNTEAESSSSL